MPDSSFQFQSMFPLGPRETPWRKLSSDFVRVVEADGEEVLRVEPEALELLAKEAMHDIAHFLRPGHLQQLRNILEDPEASDNDRFVALDLLQNANIASGAVLPMCQDTGTAIIIGEKGQFVWTSGSDGEALSRGVFRTYADGNLRYSQLAPLGMFEEVNTKTNLPAQIDLYSKEGSTYDFLFLAKGGGSANKTYLIQSTPSMLREDLLLGALREKIKEIGTAACPPYHLAVVIGGTSAEQNLKTVKLASARYLDTLPTKGNALGHAYRDLDFEEKVHALTRDIGLGAQFGGKYFCHDVRVIRLPRHGASLPLGIGVSCSADRQALGRISKDGVFLEQLEKDPARFLPDTKASDLGGEVVELDLNQSMDDIRKTLSQYPVRTRLSLSGTMVVARDLAHSKLRERLEQTGELPEYMKDCPIYYAGPAKTPEGYVSGAFGPTTAGRMDNFVDLFQQHGASMVMVAKGNRSQQVVDACRKHGGFYLGSVGGAAARLAQDCIRKVEVLEYEELGMEAIWKIEVEKFPAFLITDDKGNDFFLGSSDLPILRN
ncbi:MAG: fumarate hydratase [Planctomycetota bacterium]|nr:fumarate hydratase [Planctomycetota bacterium]MDA1114753.1 fumarate hydratase [Planctomycetota bacterium]